MDVNNSKDRGLSAWVNLFLRFGAIPFCTIPISGMMLLTGLLFGDLSYFTGPNYSFPVFATGNDKEIEAEIESILSNHPSLNIEENSAGKSKEMQPLHYAVEYGNAAAVRLLIEAGAEVDEASISKAVHSYLSNSSPEESSIATIKLLFNANSSMEDFSWMSLRGWKFSDIDSYSDEEKLGKLEELDNTVALVKILLEAGMDPNKISYSDVDPEVAKRLGLVGLRSAISYEDLVDGLDNETPSIVTYLLAQGGISALEGDADKVNFFEETLLRGLSRGSLYRTAPSKYLEIAQYLVDKKLYAQYDSNGTSVFCRALMKRFQVGDRQKHFIFWREPEITREFLAIFNKLIADDLDFNRKDSFGRTPAMLLAAALVEACAFQAQAINSSESSSTSQKDEIKSAAATQNYMFEIFEEMLRQKPDFNILDDEGNSAGAYLVILTDVGRRFSGYPFEKILNLAGSEVPLRIHNKNEILSAEQMMSWVDEDLEFFKEHDAYTAMRESLASDYYHGANSPEK